MSAELAQVEASDLLQKAMTFFDTDRQAARQYLTDALVLLGTKAEARPAEGYQWRHGGLPRWQVQRALAYIESNLGSKLTVAGIARIALACGFSDQSHFTKLFHRRVGLSPSAWRRINATRP